MVKETDPPRRFRGTRRIRFIRGVLVAATLLALPAPATSERIDWVKARSLTQGRVYVDAGYLLSSNRPGNHTWRSKGTTTVLDRLQINNAALTLERSSAADAPWGFKFGVQAGRDVDNLVTDGAVSSAEALKHLHYTNVSYLFDVGHGLVVGGGLIPGHIGYESFRALLNPTYTRIYGVDNVPYFNWGVAAEYAEGEPVSGALLVIDGWDYLSRTNDLPSYGLQLTWLPADPMQVTQNLYYGPDQAETDTRYWRFVSNTIVEWSAGSLLLAGTFGYGTERRADVPGDPRQDWLWGAVWIRWRLQPAWSVTLRPEIFRDQDGLITSSRQTIRAVTVGLEGRLTPADRHDLSLRLEYRFDRSTGPDGGFFEGDANVLVPEQQLLIFAAMWQFGS